MLLERTVSVVVPTYRRYDVIRRALSSVLEQTWQPCEIIVCNDGIDDRKRAVVESIPDPRINYIEAPHRGNASATRNFAISFANGSWIALLDDDDIWLPDKLERQFAALSEQNLDSAILTGVQRVHFQGGHVSHRPKDPQRKPMRASDVLFGKRGQYHTSTLVAPTEVFKRYRFNEEIERHEDWEWLLNAGRILPIVVCAKVVSERWVGSGERLSTLGQYDFSCRWYRRNLVLMSRKCRVRFVCEVLCGKALHDRQYSAFWQLTHELVVVLRANPFALVRGFLPWILPPALRSRIRSWRSRQA